MADSIERRVVTYMGTQAALTALVGTRVYPQMAPEGTAYPYLLYHRIGTQRGHGLNSGDGAPIARLEFTAWGGRGPGGYDTAKAVAAVLVPILEGLRAALGAKFCHSCFVDDEFDVTESPEFATADDPRGVTFQVSISYDETLTNTAP